MVLAETGRQPVDNPDTHLELTMIHEGALLEYGGRDLAPTSTGPQPRGTGSCWCSRRRSSSRTRGHVVAARRAAAVLVVLCAGLALTETLVAKMRILLVPRLLAVGAAVALLGIVTWLVENA